MTLLFIKPVVSLLTVISISFRAVDSLLNATLTLDSVVPHVSLIFSSDYWFVR